MKEAEIQKCILDYLAATGTLAFRMNTGAVKIEKRFMRFGTPGMADILSFPRNKRVIWSNYDTSKETEVLWIECKTDKGTQSELQKSFQKQVESNGHRYLLARSVDDVIAAVE